MTKKAKIIIKTFLLITAMVFCISSCSQTVEETSKNSIVSETSVAVESYSNNDDKIVVLDDHIFIDTEHLQANNITIIPSEAEKFTELFVKHSKVLYMFGNKYELQYAYSLFYPEYGISIRWYSIEGTDNGTIGFHKDGSFHAILGETIATLNISPTDSVELLRAELEETLGDELGLSKYSEFKYNDWGNSYNFVYYNLINECRNEWLAVEVSHDGSVSRLIIHPSPVTNKKIVIDKELEKELIEQQLDIMYNTDKTRLLAYEQSNTPEISLYDDKIYVTYTLSITLDQYYCVNKIMIPITLLSGK